MACSSHVPLCVQLHRARSVWTNLHERVMLIRGEGWLHSTCGKIQQAKKDAKKASVRRKVVGCFVWGCKQRRNRHGSSGFIQMLHPRGGRWVAFTILKLQCVDSVTRCVTDRPHAALVYAVLDPTEVAGEED